MALTPVRKKLLYQLLLELYRDSEPAAGNRRLRDTLESAAAGIGDALPGNTVAQLEYVHKALDAWCRHGASLVDLRQALIRDNDRNQTQIDRYFGPAMAHEALRKSDISVAEDDLFAKEYPVDLINLVNQHVSSDGPAPLLDWLELFAPLVEPGATTLPPPVLYLTLCENRLTQASLRSVVLPSLDLELPLPPGAVGIEFRGKDDLVGRIREIAVRAVRQFGAAWKLKQVADLVLIIDADPSAVSLQLETVDVPSTEDTLGSWMRGVAWWPQIQGLSVEGCPHDGPLPAPGDMVARWDTEIPADREARQRASLGVWAGPGVWSPDCKCKILGYHGRRYFAVLANQPLEELLPQIHPNDAPASLQDLFERVRGRGQLVWTDSRYSMDLGVYIP